MKTTQDTGVQAAPFQGSYVPIAQGLFDIDLLGGEPRLEKTTQVPLVPLSHLFKARLVRCPMDPGAVGAIAPPDTALPLHTGTCTSVSVTPMSHCGAPLATGMLCSARF